MIFCALKTGQALQAHFENGLRLVLGELEALHQVASCAIETSFDSRIVATTSSM